MSFLKLNFSRMSPSPSKSKGRSALSTTSLIKQTERDLKLNIEKSKSISPFGHYKTYSFADTTDISKDFLSITENSSKTEKNFLENLVIEYVNKYLEDSKTKLADQILLKFEGFKELHNLKTDLETKYSDLSNKIDEINILISNNESKVKIIVPTVEINKEYNNKEYLKCVSNRSEFLYDDMEENTSNLNEIKFLENNMNNLRWKDSSKKSEILISKKNSNHSDNNVESNYLLDEINKLKVKLEDLEKGLSEKKEIVINEDRLNNPLQLRLASSTKNKKQESLDTHHQQTPSFDQKTEFKFTISNSNNQKKAKKFNESSDSMDICLTDFPQKLETELTKNDSNPHNNDYSPALSQNKYVETFHEKYLIDKIRLEKENPLNDDYLKKKKSINNYVCNGSKEDDNRLRSSYGYKSFDDFDVGYEKDNFVPLFNFNSNKSQFTSHNSKKDGMIKANTSNLFQDLDNDVVELGTNEAKSVHEYDNFSLTENFPVFEENDLLKQKPERYEIQEEDSKDEKDDNDVIIYHVDENNFLMDENGIYIYDNENNHMEISVENFEHLRKSYGS